MTSLSIKDFDAAMNLGATSKAGVSKLVQAWEAKNNERTKRAAGLGLMAVSLAACGGSDDTPYSQDDVDQLEDEISSLTTERDALATQLSEIEDAIEAAGHDDVDALIAQRDQLVEDLEAAEEEIAALEQARDDLLADLAPFTSATFTVNDDLIITLDGDNALTATNLTMNAGDVVIDVSGDDSDSITITATAGVTAGVIQGYENITINASSFAALTHALDGIADGTVTINNLQVGGATGATVTGAGDITVVAGSGVTGTLTVTEAADASTVVDAGGAATVVINATAGALVPTVDFIANGDVALTVNAATVALNIDATAASVVTLTTGAGLTTITGDANTTLLSAGTINAFNGDTISGFAAVAGSGGVADLSLVSSPISITAGAAGATLTLADGASVSTLDTGAHIITAVDDGDLTAVSSQSVNLTLAASVASITTGPSGGGDLIDILNLTAQVAQAGLTITAATATTINLSGSANATIVGDATAGDVLNASELTGNLTVIATAGLLSITGGSGDDTITARTGAEFVLDGGAGDDTLGAVANMTTGTFSNFEIVNTGVATTHDFNASQLSGTSLVINAAGANSVVSIDGTVATGVVGSVDLTTIDLSGLQFSNANASTIVNVSTIDPAQFLATQSFTITGSDAADAITGSANADTISGGEGTDTITGGAGADNLTGGAGADVFAFANSDSGVTVATADIITDFTTTEDDIDLAGYLVASAATDYSEADGSAAADFDALVALADAAFANDIGDGVHVLFNALGTGDAYVFFDASGDKAFGTGDTLIILTGVSTAADIIAADFI